MPRNEDLESLLKGYIEETKRSSGLDAIAETVAHMDRTMRAMEHAATKRHAELLLAIEELDHRISSTNLRVNFLEESQRELSRDVENTGKHNLETTLAKVKDLEGERKGWILFVAKGILGLLTVGVGALLGRWLSK